MPLSEPHTITPQLPAIRAAAALERSRRQERSRADLPQAVELEKDFTELMMSDTSASVSEPSQCVRHVAPLPGEAQNRDSVTVAPTVGAPPAAGTLPHHCLTSPQHSGLQQGTGLGPKATPPAWAITKSQLLRGGQAPSQQDQVLMAEIQAHSEGLSTNSTSAIPKPCSARLLGTAQGCNATGQRCRAS